MALVVGAGLEGCAGAQPVVCGACHLEAASSVLEAVRVVWHLEPRRGLGTSRPSALPGCVLPTEEPAVALAWGQGVQGSRETSADSRKVLGPAAAGSGHSMLQPLLSTWALALAPARRPVALCPRGCLCTCAARAEAGPSLALGLCDVVSPPQAHAVPTPSATLHTQDQE